MKNAFIFKCNLTKIRFIQSHIERKQLNLIKKKNIETEDSKIESMPTGEVIKLIVQSEINNQLNNIKKNNDSTTLNNDNIYNFKDRSLNFQNKRLINQSSAKIHNAINNQSKNNHSKNNFIKNDQTIKKQLNSSSLYNENARKTTNQKPINLNQQSENYPRRRENGAVNGGRTLFLTNQNIGRRTTTLPNKIEIKKN